MTGRPSSFTQETADAICDRLAEGESLRTVCGDEKMPDLRTVRRWLVKGSGQEAEPEFAAFRLQYARAREDQADYYAEKIVDDAASATDAAIGRLRMDALKWAASKLAPKRYGDKVALTGGSDTDEPIKTSLTVTFVRP